MTKKRINNVKKKHNPVDGEIVYTFSCFDRKESCNILTLSTISMRQNRSILACMCQNRSTPLSNPEIFVKMSSHDRAQSLAHLRAQDPLHRDLTHDVAT